MQRNNPQRFGKGNRRFRNQRTSGDHSDYRMIKISQNTEKSPGDLRRLAVIQTHLEDHQQALLWKSCIIMIITTTTTTDHLISTRRLNRVLINKKKRTCCWEDFAVPANFRVNKKRKQKDRQILGPYQRTKKKQQQQTNCGVWGWRWYQL